VDLEKELETEIALLRGIATFDVLDDEALRFLATHAEARSLAAGEALFRAGEAADCGYVLVSGCITLADVRPDGVTRAELKVEPVALIGETALITPGPRPALAVAAEPCALLRISRTTFLMALERAPQAAAKLRRNLARRLERTLKALDKVRGDLENPRPAPRTRSR